MYDDDTIVWTDVLSDLLRRVVWFVTIAFAFMVGTVAAMVGLARAGYVIDQPAVVCLDEQAADYAHSHELVCFDDR